MTSPATDPFRALINTTHGTGNHQALNANSNQERHPMSDKPSVLFVCVHNAGRSQMAAGWLRHLAGDTVEVRSAGSAPGKAINPAAAQAMAEVGIDITDQTPKKLEWETAESSDVIITMGCGDACPFFPGKRYEDWKLDDPAGQGIEAVRLIRDEIRGRVEHLVTQLTLYAEVAGTGEPVLLLHGGFCSLESLRAQSDALIQDHQVHAFERPGHGRSPDIDGEYSYARGVAEALSYLDAAGLESAHIVGYSDGAIIGLLLAMDHPERVRSLTAISANLDPSIYADDAEETKLDAIEIEERPDLERAHYERLSPDGPEHAEVVLAKLFRLWTSEPHIDPADLSRIQAPVLVMSGDRDSIPPSHSLLIASSIPGAQLSIVPGTTHTLIAERPDLVNGLIRDFLRQAAQPRERRNSQTK